MQSIRYPVRRMLCIVVALVAASVPPAAAEDSAQSNAVTRWVDQALSAVRQHNVGTPNAGRLYAMATVAMYDAVNGIETARHHGRQPAMVPADGAPIGANVSVAAAAAAHAVLTALVPDRRPVLDDALLAETNGSGGSSSPPVARAVEWGRSVGQRVVLIRSTDGTQTADPMPAGFGAGAHRAAFDARFRHMAPFGIADASAYGSGPPPALSSAEYAAAFEDVKRLGRPDGDAERNQISNFWLAEGGTVRETGTWMQAALVIAAQQQTTDSVPATARLFALVGMAIADAVTASWDTKATYFSWRPTVAIQEAGSDGNDATVAEPGWVSRIGSAGGSPEYNSGTSAFAGAASAVIESFYGDPALAFCFRTDKATHGNRCYPSLLAGAEEAGRSRIYQGIHFQFSNEDGRRVGRAIGFEIGTTRLCRPIANGGCH